MYANASKAETVAAKETAAAQEAAEKKKEAAAAEAFRVLLSYKRREKSTLGYGLWAVSFALVIASIGSWTNILLKSGIEMVSASFSGENQAVNPLFWLFIGSCAISAIMQLLFTDRMMSTFPAVFVVPIYQCLFTLCLINDIASTGNVTASTR